MSTQADVELSDFAAANTEVQHDDTTHADVTTTSRLPAPDSSRQAYLFLLAAFAIEAIVWGFPFSSGVLQIYYATHPPFEAHPSGLGAIGTTCTGIMYIGGAVACTVIQNSAHLRVWSVRYGTVLVVLAVALSSFATRAWQLIATQGVLYAFGGTLLYFPFLLFIDEWFVTRKAVAYGVMWAGTGIGGLVAPFIIQWGLDKYGVQHFLWGWAVMLAVCLGLLLMFSGPRVPWSGPQSRSLRARLRLFTHGFGFLRTGTFWILQTAVILQGLGYFIPLVYLPDYAKSLGLSALKQSASVSIVNTCSIFGLIFWSLLGDRVHVTTVMSIIAVGSSIAVFLFWGLSSPAPNASWPLLATFAALYGFFAGGFTATFPSIAKELRSTSDRHGLSSELGGIFGLLSFGRGVGNVACGPISETLVGQNANAVSFRQSTAYGSGYGPLIMFTGAAVACTMLPWTVRKLRLLKIE